MSLPRDLIEIDWFQTVATWNPVSYMLEGIRSLVIEGWDAEALALGFALRRRRRADRARGRLVGAPDADGADVSRGSFTSAARAVAWRNVHNWITNPALIVPSLLFPLFFFTAFAGGLSRVDSVPGFDYERRLHDLRLRLRAAPGGHVRRHLHRLLGGARLRVRLRAPADARRDEPRRHRRGLLAVGADPRVCHDHGDHGRGADRGARGARQRHRPGRPLHARAAAERVRGAVRHRRGDAAAHDAGRARRSRRRRSCCCSSRRCGCPTTCSRAGSRPPPR